jgi:hypothetical protein
MRPLMAGRFLTSLFLTLSWLAAPQQSPASTQVNPYPSSYRKRTEFPSGDGGCEGLNMGAWFM